MRNAKPDLLERLVASADNALKTLLTPAPQASRATPADAAPEQPLSDSDRALSAGLMRVNHAGEVAAQALYQGHALVARSPALHAQLQHAADEEFDHLAWCRERLDQLGARPSVLNAAWYAGAYAIGAASGIAGDRWGLGFIEETERQVAEHLTGHLQRLPGDDARSKAILKQMRDEEEAHGADAHAAGATTLPRPVRGAMKLAAGIMKAGAFRL